jgi:hypothetical protein
MVAFVPANLDQNDVKKKWNQNKLAEKQNTWNSQSTKQSKCTNAQSKNT